MGGTNDGGIGERLGRRMALARPLLALAVFGATLAIGAVAAELYLRFAVDPLAVLDGDAMWELRWRESREGDERAAGLQREYGFDRFDPQLGWVPRESYESPSIRTNAAGIRADREFPRPKPDGTKRVVVLGDSFVWGEEVSNEEAFVTRLDQRMEGVDVVNLGVHGYGTGQQLLRLRELGLALEPDLVLLGFYEGDLSRNVLSFRDYAKPVFRLRQGELVLDNVPVPAPEELLAAEQRLPPSFLLVTLKRKLRKWSESGLTGTERSEAWRVSRAILDETLRESEQAGARLGLIYIPYDRFDEATPLEILLARWAGERRVPYLNLREIFSGLAEDDKKRLYRGHWTPFGNDVVARLTERFIERERLLVERSASHGEGL